MNNVVQITSFASYVIKPKLNLLLHAGNIEGNICSTVWLIIAIIL